MKLQSSLVYLLPLIYSASLSPHSNGDVYFCVTLRDLRNSFIIIFVTYEGTSQSIKF